MKTKPLTAPGEPFQIPKLLLRFVRQNQCCLFIGSGVSSEAGMPSVQDIQDSLQRELEEMGIPPAEDATLPKVAMLLEDAAGRAYLIGVLHDMFSNALRNSPWKCGAYPWIPRLPNGLVKVIYTSNWDDLLKRAFQDARQTALEIRYPEERTSSSEHRIVKVCRDLESQDGPIVSEHDYIPVWRDLRRGTTDTLWGDWAKKVSEFSFIVVGHTLGDPALDPIRWIVKRSKDPLEKARPQFLVAPLTEVESQAARECTGMRVIVASTTEFLRALSQELSK